VRRYAAKQLQAFTLAVAAAGQATAASTAAVAKARADQEAAAKSLAKANAADVISSELCIQMKMLQEKVGHLLVKAKAEAEAEAEAESK
jgi:hypothetical protein